MSVSSSESCYFTLHIPKLLPKDVALTRLEQVVGRVNGRVAPKDSKLKTSPSPALNGTALCKVSSGKLPLAPKSPAEEAKDKLTQDGGLTDVSKRIIEELERTTGNKVFAISSDHGYSVTFACDTFEEADNIRTLLTARGVGVKYGSSHIFHCALAYRAAQFHPESLHLRGVGTQRHNEEQQTVRSAIHGPELDRETTDDNNEEEDVLLVGQRVYERVHADIRSSSALTLDFVLLTILASLLAGVSLCVNNVVVIVASMLVSPLMGPILAITLGLSNSQFRDLVCPAMMVECLALGLCVLCGFLVGVVFSPWGDRLNWPNPEMEGRGHVNGLLIGVGIAVPSGVGVALGLISNNVASLVGVAISASLLPPAVNCGICIAFAMFGEKLVLPSSGGIKVKVDASRFYKLGAVSLALTIVNILCIIVIALGVFYYKIHAKYPGKAIFYDWMQIEDATKTVKGRQHGVRLNGTDLKTKEGGKGVRQSSLRNLFMEKSDLLLVAEDLRGHVRKHVRFS